MVAGGYQKVGFTEIWAPYENKPVTTATSRKKSRRNVAHSRKRNELVCIFAGWGYIEISAVSA